MPDHGVLLAATLIFLLAGFVKGVVGMGLPTVAMGLMGLLMAPVQAAALLIIPSLVTNVWQFFAGPAAVAVTRRLVLMLFFVCLGTALGIPLLVAKDTSWPGAALGSVLVLYAIAGLRLPRISVPRRLEPLFSPVVGLITGLLTGATGVFVVPAVPYLGSLGLTKDELVQALGLSFTVSTVALGLALGFRGAYTSTSLTLSALAVLPALVGMFIGQQLRNRLDQQTFRRWFFAALFLIGLYLTYTSLFSRPTQ